MQTIAFAEKRIDITIIAGRVSWLYEVVFGKSYNLQAISRKLAYSLQPEVCRPYYKQKEK
jgi:hypothetical protein